MTGARVEHLPALETAVVEQRLLCDTALGALHRGGDHGVLVRRLRVLELFRPFAAPRRRDRGKNGGKTALKNRLRPAVYLENQPYVLYIMG